MADMPRPHLPYLQCERVNGKTFWYVRMRRDLPRVRIRGEYGSDEFKAAYHAAVSGQPLPAKPGKAATGSLRWLVDEWKRSSDWNGTAMATRRQRENILLHVLEENGDVPFASIVEDDIFDGRERRQAKPFAANNFLKTMRALFRWAKERKHVSVDPARDVPFLNVETEGFTPWTISDVEAYRARWPLGTRERVALEVLCNTGLRRSDAVRLGRQHVRDKVATITTMKNKVTVHIPLMPALIEAIEAGPVGDLTFITGVRSLPLTKESFGTVFRGYCDAAKIAKGKSAHGLRKYLATTLADNGGSERELMALFGWLTNTQSLDYTRDADNRRLALQAAMRIMGEDEDAKKRTKAAQSIP